MTPLPEFKAEQAATARALGYGEVLEAVLAMRRTHDPYHVVAARLLGLQYSPTLHWVASGAPAHPTRHEDAVAFEENLCLDLQRWMQTAEYGGAMRVLFLLVEEDSIRAALDNAVGGGVGGVHERERAVAEQHHPLRADEAPDQLLAHPLNPKIHPRRQQDALAGAIAELGWIAPVIVNETTGHVIDGHARIGMAIARHEASVPVAYVQLTPEQEQLALVTFDLIAMAATDKANLEELLREVRTDDAALRRVLRDLADDNGLAWGGDQEERTPPPDAPLFTDEQIVDAAFAHFRASGFPYRRLPLHTCMQEINRLARLRGGDLFHTTAGYQVADTYHPHRFHAAGKGEKSPIEAFEDDTLLRRTLRLTLEQGATISEDWLGKLAIISQTQACSNFRPGFACALYRRYCEPGATVLDTSAGYGGRLVGFLASGMAGRYIGIDPHTLAHEGNMRLAADLAPAEAVELHCAPVEDVPHEVVADRCDFAFTSPPYFANERYSDEPTQSWVRYPTGEAWRDGFLRPTLALQAAALKAGAFAIVNIEDVTLRGKHYPLVAWTREAAVAAGLAYVRTDAFVLHGRMGAGQDVTEVAQESVLVFRKPSCAS